MNCGKPTIKKLLAGAAMVAVLSFAAITGCTTNTGPEDGLTPDSPVVSQATHEPASGSPRGEHGDGNERSRSSGEGAGEHRPENDTGSAESGEGNEANEAAMSGPITSLSQPWNGVLGGLAVSMQYDPETRTVHGTVRNTLSHRLCYVQAEPHMKSGTRMVGELGPDKLGYLDPGQETFSTLSVDSEPTLAGVTYDSYVVHMETFDCEGPGPAAHTGEGSEKGGNHGPGGEHGRESAASSEEEGSINALTPGETHDADHGGARLVLKYDPSGNSFKGYVENTTNRILERVRVEIHLSNGAELGPTAPADMAPGEIIEINLPATQGTFTGWTAHAEAGTGEERGGEEESGGEHGGGESRGQQGGNESGKEHGGDGEQRDGG